MFNRFQSTSLSQTMGRMRRRYNSKSSGGSAAPRTPYTPSGMPPVADAGDDQTVDVDTDVTFDGSGSRAHAGRTITSYSWNFGSDATPATGTGVSPSCTYSTPGEKTVTLTVTDSGGDTDSDTMTVTVSEPIVLTLTGPDTVTRGDATRYTASITPAGLTLDTTPTFKWKYTTTVRTDRDTVRITENIDATAQNPQTTTWSGTMVSGGTLEVRTTVNGTEYVQTMNVTVNDRTWGTEVPITTDTTSWGTEAPGQHSDLGDVEYDMPFTPADDLETAEVSSGPNKGILYIASLNLTAPFTVRINRHFGMAAADFPPCWVAFKEANTRYGEIEAKVKARLGFDGTTSGTLYGSWESEIHYSDPKANLEEFMEVPGYLSDYETQIVYYVEYIQRSRKAGMDRQKSGWSPSGITINYNYFAADAGDDQTVDVNTPVTFDGSASCVSSGRTIASYSWDFGPDATPATGTGDSPSCTYSTHGEKTVTLTVTDSGGNTDSDTMIVTVKALPVAVAGDDQTVEFDSDTNSVSVSFDGSNSYDPDNGTNPGDGIVSYNWSFGDGSTGTGATPSHTYTAPGIYDVTLTIKDDEGDKASDSMTVTVVSLTLTGSDTVTRGDMATYTASITPEGLTLNDTLTFNWTYTTTVRDGRDAVSITESIDATAQTTTWSGAMVSSGTLEVRTTVNGTELAQTMDVTVNNRTWGTDVSITTDTTSLDTEEPRQHSDLGDVEYDIQYTPADDLETAKVSSGPNKGIWYIASINLTAPLVVKINKHFGMDEAALPACWVAFKKANTRYSEIEGKVKTRLGFDGTTSGTLYGCWVSEIEDNDPEANLEKFMEEPNRLLFDYENQIADRVEALRTSRNTAMDDHKSGWSPSGITINYSYFVADAGEDQTVDVNTEVIFDGSASCLPAGHTINETTGYSWNFGSDADPATSVGNRPRCTYSTPGEKMVNLIVTDSGGITACDTMTVTVTAPPVADAGPDQVVPLETMVDPDTETATTSATVMFDGSKSHDPDNGTNPEDGIVCYDWSFGDEDDSTGSGATPSHTYTSPGIYEVTLKVTDDEGQTGYDKMNVTVFSLTLTGLETVNRGRLATYTASIVPEGLTVDAPTFNWKYIPTVREDQDLEPIEESINPPAQDTQTTTWRGQMVSPGTLEVRTTVYNTELVQTMAVTINPRMWRTDVPLCTDTTSLGAEAPRAHTDLGNVEYDLLFSPAHDLETVTVEGGPNNGISFIKSVKLTAPLVAKINRHFRMAEADLPPTWMAFKNANTRYDDIKDKLEARLGFDVTTSGTLYEDWVNVINAYDPREYLEGFMGLSDFGDQIAIRVKSLTANRKSAMDFLKSGWSPTGITINYDYFAARAGSDQTVDVNTEVIFDGSASFALAGRTINDPSGYSWNFGSDADPATSVGKRPRYTYSTTGEKTVTLTVTDSEGDTSCDTMTVIVAELSKRHPDIPVGMMGIQDKQLTELEETFQSIYVGDSNFSHPACNYLHSYGLDFNTSTGWGLLGVPFSRPPYERHAIAWANFVGSVKDVNNRLAGAKLKCLISNRLMHMKLVQNWSLEDISSYVRHTIHKIDMIAPTRVNPNPKDIVAGWNLGDDVLAPKKTNYTVDEMRRVVHAVHRAQKACGVNWPFYFTHDVDTFWNASSTDVVIPNRLKNWVGAFPDDATPVFMPYYYPWIANNWNYTEHPPWKKWKLYIDKLHEEFFPSNREAIHDNLQFHPILDASEKMAYRSSPTLQDPDRKIRDTANLPLPGHADMHKQIRVVWNLLQEYNSVTGIWLLGWDVDDGVALQRATAHNNWTENRKWAKAIQNEPYRTEEILEAVPDVSKIHLPFKTSDTSVTGKRIPYSLSERKRFEIRIYDDNLDDNPNAKLVRTLDEGYDDISPQGEFKNSNYSGRRYEDLRGTSAYWDLHDSDGDSAGPGLYYVYLYVDGTRAAGHQTITIEEED